MTALDPHKPARLCFGDYTLELQPDRLTRQGATVPLQSQPLRLLTLLVARAGEVVPHKDIRHHVWGALQVDFASGMHVCIAQIRKALEDTGDPPRYIETVPRRGYRFVAEVVAGPPERAPPESAAAPVGSSTQAPPGAMRPEAHSESWWSLLALVIAGGMALAYLGVDPARRVSAPLAPVVAAPDDAYLQGLQWLAAGDEAAALRSRAAFRRAISADPDFAPAYVALAQSFERTRHYTEAHDLARQALAIDPTYAQAFVRLAAAQAACRWDWAGAEQNLRSALALAPDDAEATLALASAQLITGRREAARRTLATALMRGPADAHLLAHAGLLHYFAWDFAVAREHCAAAQRLEPELDAATLCLYKLARVSVDLDDARAHALTLLRSQAAGDAVIATIANRPAASALQHFEAWRLEGLDAQVRAGTSDPLLHAYSLAALGRYDEAFFYLLRGRDQRYAGTPLSTFDPIFIPIRHQSKYLEMLDDMGVVYSGL